MTSMYMQCHICLFNSFLDVQIYKSAKSLVNKAYYYWERAGMAWIVLISSIPEVERLTVFWVIIFVLVPFYLQCRYDQSSISNFVIFAKKNFVEEPWCRIVSKKLANFPGKLLWSSPWLVSLFHRRCLHGNTGKHFRTAFSRTLTNNARSSHRGCSKNFAHLTGKHLCWSLFLIKLQAWGPVNCIKSRLQHRCFPVKLANFLRKTILKNIYERLLLNCLCPFRIML